MNLLFAIGAHYSNLTNADWAEDKCDHRVYMNRAVRLLGLKDTLMIISGPDLRTVQAVSDRGPFPEIVTNAEFSDPS
jgi:hypothetical protein